MSIEDTLNNIERMLQSKFYEEPKDLTPEIRVEDFAGNKICVLRTYILPPIGSILKCKTWSSPWDYEGKTKEYKIVNVETYFEEGHYSSSDVTEVKLIVEAL